MKQGNKIILSFLIFFTFLAFALMSCSLFTLIWHNSNSKTAQLTNANVLSGSGTESDPYLIYSIENYRDLYTTGNRTTKVYAKLMNDLTIRRVTDLPTCRTRASADDYAFYEDDKFIGGLVFDGNFKEINCTFTYNAPSYNVGAIGPIPCINGPSEIKNLKTSGTITITGKSSFNLWCGGLIGVASGTYIYPNTTTKYPNVTIENCYVGLNFNVNTTNKFVGAAGLIGFVVADDGLFADGNVSVSETAVALNITGSCLHSGSDTSTISTEDYNIKINTSDTYFLCEINGINYSTLDSADSFSNVYDSNATFVKGKWTEGKYADYGYQSNPALIWLQYRNNVGINPYVVTYEIINSDGIKIVKTTSLGYLIDSGDYKIDSWGISTFNFGVIDQYASFKNLFNMQSYSYSHYNSVIKDNTVHIIVVVTMSTQDITFMISPNVDLYYSINNSSYILAESNFTITCFRETTFSIQLKRLEKTGCYSECVFTFVAPQEGFVSIKYESYIDYYITAYQYQPGVNGPWIDSTESNLHNSLLSAIKVLTELKNYNVNIIG